MPKTQTPPITIDRFRAGLFTNRSPLAVPQSNSGTTFAFAHPDALIDGSNVEISPRESLIRRPGMPKFCTSAFASSEWPLNFWGGVLTGNLVNVVDTQTNVYSFTPTTKTSILVKGTTAQTFFQKVGNILYGANGVDNFRWDGVNAVYNNGMATPTVAPTIPNLNLFDTVGATQTFHAWVPSAKYTNATAAAQNFYLLDPNNNLQWSVVPKGSTNTSQATVPNWAAANGIFGAVTQDGTMTWTNCGQIGAWAGTTLYTNATYVTTHQMSSNAAIAISMATDLGGGTVGAATFNSTSIDWWAQNGFSGNSTTVTITNLGLVVPTNATIQGIQCNLARASNRVSTWTDVTVKLLKANIQTGNNKAVGGFWPQTSWGFQNNTTVTTGGVPITYGSNADLWGAAWTPADIGNAGFGVALQINCGNTKGSVAAYTLPMSIVVYYKIGTGDITGTVYAQIIKDSNGNLQAVKTGGTSTGSAPVWSTTVGGTTADGATLVWQCLGTAAQPPALFSWTYGYSFHTASPHTSTLSPLLTVYGPMIGNNVNVQCTGSSDAQCDHIGLYRTPDGGSLLLFNQSGPNVNSSTTYTFNDNVLDINLAPTIVGPIDHLNDPPPAGMTILCRYMGRMWGVVGANLYFSAGPDCTNGNGDQAWPPANVFPMTSNIIGLEPTSQGLVVGLQDEVWAILGGPQTLSFYPKLILQNFGVLSPNCMIADADTLYLLTANNQLQKLSLSDRGEIGFPIADYLLTNYPPASSYLAIHRHGADEGLFISNGSTLLQRFSLTKGIWSPSGSIVGGVGAIGSIQTSTGVHTLLAGRAAGSDFILGRSTSSFVDGASSTYTSFATVGSIPLTPLGVAEIASIQSFVIAHVVAGTAPTLSVLPNEIAGLFTNVPFSTQDPWRLPASSTITMDRFDWQAITTNLPNAMRHLQIKMALTAENQPSEIYSLTIVFPPPSI